jgi:hypothetical protein
MTHHPSSAVSVAIVLTAAVVLALGYHFGRAHASWKDVHSSRRSLTANRRSAWRRTAQLFVGTAALLLTLVAAAYDIGH